jgi:hypothetical protein
MSKNTSKTVTKTSVSKNNDLILTSSDLAKIEKHLAECEKAAQLALDKASAVREVLAGLSKLSKKEETPEKSSKKTSKKSEITEEITEEESSEVEKKDKKGKKKGESKVEKLDVKDYVYNVLKNKTLVMEEMDKRKMKYDKKSAVADLRGALESALKKEQKKSSKSTTSEADEKEDKKSKKKGKKVEETEEETTEDEKPKKSSKKSEEKEAEEHVVKSVPAKGYGVDNHNFLYTLKKPILVVARMDKSGKDWKPLTDKDLKEFSALKIKGVKAEKKTVEDIKKLFVPRLLKESKSRESEAETTQDSDDDQTTETEVKTTEEEAEGGVASSSSSSSTSSDDDDKKKYDDKNAEGTEQETGDETKEVTKHFEEHEITEEDYKTFVQAAASKKTNPQLKNDVNAKAIGMHPDKYNMISFGLGKYQKKWPNVLEEVKESKTTTETTGRRHIQKK